MKLLHTADWHLGKTLKGQNLLDDQIFILNQLFDVISDQNPDAIIISGDIYDRGIPPAEAVELFDDILNRFAEKKLPTLIISGNHDSATRLNFGSKLFRSKNIFIVSKIEDIPAQVVLEDNFGEIYFSLIPFFDPVEIKAKFFDENAERLTFNDANKFYVDLARKNIPENKRSVAIAHVFISGEKKTDSVRDIVGGAEGIDAKIFSDYNYTALGHLHSPRFAGKNIFYSGSPLKYSFDEANHKKSVAIVEINGYGEAKIEKIDLKPRRDLIIVEGTFNELKNRPRCDDYAQIILTDDAYIYSTEELRESFPHFLEVKRKSHLKSYDDIQESNFCKDDPISEQFAKFFYEITQEKLSEEEKTAFEEFLKEIYSEEAEE